MSDYLEKMIAKAKGRDFWDDLPTKFTPPEPTEKNAVRRDSFDISAWDQITDQVPALREQVEALAEEHPTSPAAYEDLFNLLNQGDPRFTEMASMLPEYLPQHVMEQMMFASEDFGWIRNETKYDEYNTALAMLTMRERMEEAFEQVQEAIDAVQAAQALLQAAIEAAEAAQESGEGEGEAGEALEAAMAGAGQAEDDAEAAGEAASQSLADGATEAKEKIEREKAQAASFGIDPGTLRRMDFEQRRRLADRLDQNRMAKLAKLVGSWRMFSDAERRRSVKNVPSEIFDVEAGNNLNKLVSSERNNLAIPELDDLFWLKWAKQGLLQWRTKGPEREGRGPIIVVCDESASMDARLDAEGNTREAWSKALALSLCDQAKRGKRDFIYIGFAGPGSMWETQFLAGDAPIEKVIEFTEHFLCGGTSYEGPLTRALNLIGAYEAAGKSKPDVVFITDAECSVGKGFVQKWGEAKERADVRCYGIQVGGSGRYTDMYELVDRCISIDHLNASPEGLIELFRSI